MPTGDETQNINKDQHPLTPFVVIAVGNIELDGQEAQKASFTLEKSGISFDFMQNDIANNPTVVKTLTNILTQSKAFEDSKLQ